MKMLFTCRQMARLASEELDRPLSFQVKVRMFIHLLLCRDCRTYHDQIKRVDQFIESYYSTRKEPEMSLSEEAKARMIAALERE